MAPGSDESLKGGASSGVSKSDSTVGDQGVRTTRSTGKGEPVVDKEGSATSDESIRPTGSPESDKPAARDTEGKEKK